jgi:beta-lactamase superfamily II metal-dependent hydrolase
MATSSQDNTVAVRMYRGILGDCFLLRYQDAGQPRFILIDCGVLQGVVGAKQQMTLIVDDLLHTTGGTLDLLVLTHEHHDHLSGFLYEQERFFGDAFQINELWLAWTENPNDSQANALHARFDKAKTALAKVAALKAVTPALGKDSRIATVAGLTAFMGLAPAAGEAPVNLGSIIDRLKVKAGAQVTHYLEPGDVVHPSAIPTLKVNVMGPPRNEQLLRKDLPSAGTGKEVYMTQFDEALAVEDRADRIASGSDNNKAPTPPETPFARPHQRNLQQVAQHVKKIKTAAGAQPSVEQRYFTSKNAWRNIDDEWLDSAETLALKMDSDTNNTSLVLTFELPDGQVLLFPGDAQVGNWLSWGDQTYPREADKDGSPPQTLDDILRRVTLYKVGHHCSHNATLAALGLEKMNDPRLVAMIPVVGAVAKTKGWVMPYPDLLSALQRKTRNRVLIGDSVTADEAKLFAQTPTSSKNPATLSYAPDGLWVEVAISF